MWKLLLLLLVGTACAQESGDYEQENDEQLIKVATNEDHFHESSDEFHNEEESGEEDLSLSQESDHMEPDFTEKAEYSVCSGNGKCQYHAFRSSLTYHKALGACRNRRGYLSSIHSYSENNNLQKLLKRSVNNSRYVWIGVYKRGTFSSYKNLDGSELDYVHWGCGQRKIFGQRCVAMNTKSGQWFSFRCHTKLPFVCTY
ncbi:proteoglycan 3-like [Anomaloglossus baeobatrachus]|uniref:proteoglycan 3-like n=1 Tax=Anomaloglossus baeobatrachus TaxID=238106 RepID=UPI003F50AC26